MVANRPDIVDDDDDDGGDGGDGMRYWLLRSLSLCVQFTNMRNKATVIYKTDITH